MPKTIRKTYHLLILQLFGNVAGARARNFDPGLGEEGTSRKHESDVEGSVDRVENGFLHGVRRRHVVRNARSGDQLRRVFHGLNGNQYSCT